MIALLGRFVSLLFSIAGALVSLVLTVANGLLEFILAALVALRTLAGALVRLACSGLCAFGFAGAIQPIATAYGGDVAALLVAGCLLCALLAFVVMAGAGFGGLALAGISAFVLGAILPTIDPIVRVMLLLCLIGVAFVHTLIRKGGHHVR